MIKLSIFLTFILSALLSAKTKIACVGDSITFGAGVVAREKLCYPAQLGYLLGNDYEVRNFGIGGCTMLNKGDKPYTKQQAYQNSLAFQPDIVIIKLGTNDSKPQNWKHKADFINDAKSLIDSYAKLPSKPRIILCKPVVVTKTRWGISEKVTRGEVAKHIESVSFETGRELVDLHPFLLDKPEFLPDGVHPDAFGAERMARYLHQILLVEKDVNFSIPLIEGEKKSSFHGFTCLDFKLHGVACKVVKPKKAAKDKPWIWRARFWGHQPQLDIALLERGWHVVYCDVANLFGAPVAVKRWNEFYAYTQTLGLNKKVVLEGMSRGGLIIHNWAIANPNKIAGIIADNPVMDFKSWPAGFGKSKGSANSWQHCKQAYGFKTDDEAKAYKLNPIDTFKNIIESKIPVLYVIGDADKVVPADENALKVRDQQPQLSRAEFIIKSGKGHHPHSLPNPQPIIDFAVKGYDLYKNPASYPAPSVEFRRGAGWGGGIWWDQHEKINNLAKENNDLELILLGDSITQSWTGAHQRIAKKDGKRPIDIHFATHWRTASFGISGDRTEHLLYRIQNGNFDGLSPKAVVVMIGVNNILGEKHNDWQIADGITRIVYDLQKKLPKTQIILHGPFPSGFKPEEKRRKTIEKTHKRITNLGKLKNVHYINLTKDFTNDDGTLKKNLYSGDGIHLRKQGYEAWAKALKPHLEKILK